MQISIQTQTTYDIISGEHIVVEQLSHLLNDRAYFICLDQRVAHFHGTRLQPIIDQAKAVLLIESTESNKSEATVQQILSMLHEHFATRSSHLIAIGGGIIGDVVGYAAAIYMRGIPFIQVPTTLLAQVDSSIGSKVAINGFQMKNNIGTFYSPKSVIIDIAFLETLTERLFKEGLVELMKHGFIASPHIIDALQTCENLQALRTDKTLLRSLIHQSLAVKKEVVENDFHDTGWRHILNFGHTFAHALELSAASHLYHGECVAIGLLVSAKLSQDPQVFTTIYNLLAQFHCIKPLQAADLTKIAYDKKRSNQVIKEVVLNHIGEPEIIAYDLAILQQQFANIYLELQQTESLKTCAQQFVFHPVKLSGSVTIPPSKSYAHRYIIAAALAQSHVPIVLRNMYDLADDIWVTINATKALGITPHYDSSSGILTLAKTTEHDATTHNDDLPTVQMRESGTSLRLLLPVLVHQLGHIRMIGENQLPHRPLQTYLDCFDAIDFSFEIENQFLPLRAKGTILPKKYTLSGDISSQFISGLLFVLPLLTEDSTVELTTPLQSLPYVQMTLEVLEQFNIHIAHGDDYQSFYIKGNQKYCASTLYHVEQDYSSRGFWEVANALGPHDITILPSSTSTTQGDAIVTKIVHTKQPSIDLTHAPDTAPIMSILFAHRGGCLHHTERLRFKESDRLAAICEFLTKMTVPYEIEDDTLCIQSHPIHGNTFHTYHDHRITMSLIIASTIAHSPFYLSEITSCTKSYKTFIQHYELLGGFVDEK